MFRSAYTAIADWAAPSWEIEVWGERDQLWMGLGNDQIKLSVLILRVAVAGLALYDKPQYHMEVWGDHSLKTRGHTGG